MAWTEIRGHDDALATFRTAVAKGRLGQAYRAVAGGGDHESRTRAAAGV